MSIIGKVERKNWKTKVLNISIHVILLLGATTMVYPLLIMIAGSFKSDVDFFNFTLSPEYVYNDTLLYQKFLLSKYNGNQKLLFNSFRMAPGAVNKISPPKHISRARYEDYKFFLDRLRAEKPHYWRSIGMAREYGVDPLNLREYRDWLQRKYGRGPEGIKALNKAYGTSYKLWGALTLPIEDFSNKRRETLYNTPALKNILEFKNDHVNNLLTCWTDIDTTLIANLRSTYNNNLERLNKDNGSDYNTWSEIVLPREYPVNGTGAQVKAWRQYISDEINGCFIILKPEAEPFWQKFVQHKYNNDIQAVNKLYGQNNSSFQTLKMPLVQPESGQMRSDWNNFIQVDLPGRYLTLESLAGEYRDWLKDHYQTLDILNEEFGLGYQSFTDVELPRAVSRENIQRDHDWLAFIKSIHPAETGLSSTAISSYRKFILQKFNQNGVTDFKKMSLVFRKNIENMMEIPFYKEYPVSPAIPNRVKQLYLEFITRPENAAQRTLNDPEKMHTIWVRYLKRTYHYDIMKLNRAWSMVYTDWDKITPPTAEYEWFNVKDNRGMLIKEYLKRNYIMVFDTIQTNGFAAKNTLIYCALAVLASLLVNPLCAYGLSRFKMAPSYKILLFLMLPMAFPAMVLGIPQFLLIKNLGLLNTFAALILPTMANGYMIFLLKGFFDSLPKELFESAAIDGASEWTVFWHIAMGLSTPILSVLALNTFTAAYGNFMMAFLLCQDKSMWTMMVYLYQLQQYSSQAVGFAALIIAAIPTLLVFIFCQNIIIKGIVVPTEK